MTAPKCPVPSLAETPSFRCWGCWCWVPGAGAGAARGGDRLLAPAPVAGAGAVSWLCKWWRQVAGAGAGRRCWCPLLTVK